MDFEPNTHKNAVKCAHKNRVSELSETPMSRINTGAWLIDLRQFGPFTPTISCGHPNSHSPRPSHAFVRMILYRQTTELTCETLRTCVFYLFFPAKICISPMGLDSEVLRLHYWDSPALLKRIPRILSLMKGNFDPLNN